MRRIAVATLILLLLQSCVPVKSTSNQGLQPTPTHEVTDTPVDPGVLKIGGAVIMYQRSGGFAGITEAWTFYPDGRVISDDGIEYNLAAEQVSALLSEIEALGFFEMRDSSGLFSDCRDCFTYQLTVRSETRIKSINAVNGAADTAEEFWEIVKRINTLLDGLID